MDKDTEKRIKEDQDGMEKRGGWYLVFIFLFSAPILVYNYQSDKNEQKLKQTIKSFRQSKKLICYENLLSGKKLIVSKDTWKIFQKQSIVKDDVVLHLSTCELIKD